MIKKLILSTLLLSGFLQAQILDAKQVFNKTTTKVLKEEINFDKSYYGITKIDESSVTDIQSIQNELQIAKNFNQNIYQTTSARLETLAISKSEQQRIKDGKVDSNGIVVTSSINGILLEKNINQSSAVNKGVMLLQLASVDKIWFIASVYQSDLEYIKKDKEAQIHIDGINEKIVSKVDFIYPIIDEKNKTVDVRFVVDNKDLKLVPSMFGKVYINVKKDVMLTLPKTAVLKKANDYYVFKPLSNGEFKPVKIDAKRISSNKYEILGGLEQNDEVINNALFLLDSDSVTNALYKSDDENW